MAKRKQRLLCLAALAVMAAVMTSSCQRETVYAHYEHMPLDGWEKNDTVVFSTDLMAEEGNYTEDVGIRITNDYPFMSLQLIVTQKVLPSQETHEDTLNCSLLDTKGAALGYGTNSYQYLFRLRSIALKKEEKLYVSVRHNMKRDIMPGIIDVGFRLTKQQAPTYAQ